MAYLVAYGHDDFDPLNPDQYFHLSASFLSTALAGYQNALASAVADPDVTTIVQIDTSKTDLDRFRPFMIRANGKPSNGPHNV